MPDMWSEGPSAYGPSRARPSLATEAARALPRSREMNHVPLACISRGAAAQPSMLLLDAVHSIVAQSLNSPLGAEPVNGDGFGFGWYPADAEGRGARAVPQHRAGLARPEPALAGEAVRSRRCSSATCGPQPDRRSSRPTATRSATTAGCSCTTAASRTSARLKRDLVLAVDPDLYPLMLGTTDSEVLFHLALTLGLRDDPVRRDGARRSPSSNGSATSTTCGSRSRAASR